MCPCHISICPVLPRAAPRCLSVRRPQANLRDRHFCEDSLAALQGAAWSSFSPMLFGLRSSLSLAGACASWHLAHGVHSLCLSAAPALPQSQVTSHLVFPRLCCCQQQSWAPVPLSVAQLLGGQVWGQTLFLPCCLLQGRWAWHEGSCSPVV
jgi:hypothetical protein